MSGERGKSGGTARRDLPQLAIRWGTALLVLGILACVSLILMDSLTTFKIGAAMIAAGVLQVSHSVAGYRRGWSGFGISGALLYLLAALAVLVKPLMLDGWAEWLLVVSLACSGLSRIRAAVGLPAHAARWEVLSGAVSMVAASLIYFGMPIFSLWPIAFIVALDIVIEGAALANVGYAMAGENEPDESGRGCTTR